MKLVLLHLVTIFIAKCQSIVDLNNPNENIDIDITSAAFTLSLRQNDRHVCGATIISSNWGITAAHCVLMPLANVNYTIRSGSRYLHKGGTIHKLIKVINHEKYNPDNSDYDIGAFIVDPAFIFVNTTQPILLPPLNSNDSKKIDTNWGIAVGWGATSEFEDDLAETLKGVMLPKIHRSVCTTEYSGPFEVTPRQVCYGFPDGHKDTCNGDSGGPLFNRDYIFLGITSWGEGCGEEYSPGVYTDIMQQREWIKNTTGI